MKPLPVLLFTGVVIAAGVAMYRGNLLRQKGERQENGPIRLEGVVSANEVIVSAKVSGRIQRLMVKEGSWVKVGDLIAELDNAEVEAEQQSQLARLSQLSAKLSQSRQMVALERDRAREQIARAEAQLKVAESQLAQAVSELNQQKNEERRAGDLMASGLIPRQEYERQATLVRVGEARVKSAEDQVRATRADLELCRANQRQISVASDTERQTQAELEQAKAQLNQVSTRLDYSEIRAPQQGMISLRVAAQGEVIQPGDPIVTIVDLDDIWVRAAVEESYVSRISVGQELYIKLPSGEWADGKVLTVSPEAEFATQRDVSRAKRDIRTFGIKVQVPNPQRRIHPGMTAYILLPRLANSKAPTTGPNPGP